MDKQAVAYCLSVALDAKTQFTSVAHVGLYSALDDKFEEKKLSEKVIFSLKVNCLNILLTS